MASNQLMMETSILKQNLIELTFAATSTSVHVADIIALTKVATYFLLLPCITFLDKYIIQTDQTYENALCGKTNMDYLLYDL